MQHTHSKHKEIPCAITESTTVLPKPAVSHANLIQFTSFHQLPPGVDTGDTAILSS